MNQTPVAPSREGGPNTLKWLLIILVIIVVLGGGYLLYAKYGGTSTSAVSATPTPTEVISPSSSATPTTSPNIPAEWKTYTNKRVGYSFEYPASDLELDLNETIKYPSTRSGDSKTEDFVQFATATTTYGVRTDVSGHAMSVEAWITGTGGGSTINTFPSRNLSDYTKTTIGGKTAYTYKNGLVSYVVLGTKYYTITAKSGEGLKEEADAIDSHLLSSFKFTS